MNNSHKEVALRGGPAHGMTYQLGGDVERIEVPVMNEGMHVYEVRGEIAIHNGLKDPV
jgi:hypothetical protein